MLSMLFLKDTPIDRILRLEEIIEAVEDAVRELSLGRGYDLPRRRIHHPNRMIFGLLPGSFKRVMGAYLQTDLDRRLHHETVILYSVETGEPLILFQDCSINELRTGAAGAIGAKHLARKDASRVSVFGSSAHAASQLRALCVVRPVNYVRVFSPTLEHCRLFGRKMSRELGFEVSPAESPEVTLADTDIVITATNARTPVFYGDWLKGGMHVTSISNGDKKRTRREIDDTTIRRSSRVFITSRDTVCANESDIFRAVRDGVVSWNRVCEIGDLILGKIPGRTSDDDITLYKLQGLGIMDLAVGLQAYERLKGSSSVERL